jgi:hypothetical protein
MRTFTKEWLKASKDDLLAIEELVDNPHLTHIVAFHAQQCVEKSMKAIIEENELGLTNPIKDLPLFVIIPPLYLRIHYGTHYCITGTLFTYFFT